MPQLPSPNDFWSRKHNRQSHSVGLEPLGMAAQITANCEEALRAVELSSVRFSRAVSPKSAQPARIRIVVRGEEREAAVPPDLPARLLYSGVGGWITATAGEWGHGFANLDTREALIVLSAALAAEPVLVSRYFIDHYLTNFLFDDWGMLHASGVLTADDARLLLLIAPHNTGKSTTALRLLRAGQRFLADGMILFRARAGVFEFGGYPIGEVKLRDDVLAQFPQYSGARVAVREHDKTIVDLRAAHHANLVEEVIAPARVILCFVERRAVARSAAERLAADDVQLLLAENSVFWDEPQRFAQHAERLQSLANGAPAYRLIMGIDPDHLISTLEGLA